MMSFAHREFIAEIKYYRERKTDLEAEDLLRKIGGMKRIHEVEIKEIDDRIERLYRSLEEIM